MGALDVILKAPEFQKFQAQLQALLAMVQATDARTRRILEILDKPSLQVVEHDFATGKTTTKPLGATHDQD